MSGPAGRRFVLDRSVRRSGGGRVLVGGTPARRLQLTAAGAAALDALLAGGCPPGAEALRDRLRGHGMLHPLPRAAAVEVTFVVPVRDGGPDLGRLVEQLREWGPVLVVDDGSRDGSAPRAASAGARVILNPGRPGPAAARNRGFAAAETEFVAFVDADCSCLADWARPLAELIGEEPGLALAAPRVRSPELAGAIGRYERRRSPLDLGPDPSLVGPGRRVAYLPSAALVCRRAALLELGGFDEELRFGEDVDLVWRAVAAGWSARYAPALEVLHRPRGSLSALLRQRFEYGGSAAALDRRHPGAAAPLRVVVPSWPGRGADPELRRLALFGLAYSGRQLARALARDWLPATAGVALLSRRARVAALLCLAIDSLSATDGGWLLPPPNPALRVGENAAYAAGLWRGAVRERSAGALLPRRVRRSREA